MKRAMNLKLGLVLALCSGIGLVSMGCISSSGNETGDQDETQNDANKSDGNDTNTGSDQTDPFDPELFGGATDEDSPTAEAVGESEEALSWSDWWKGLTQGVRNATILAWAYNDLNKYVGLNCKEWARKVVSSGSNGAIDLPATCPNASGWYWCYGPKVQKMGSIYNATAGQIVQMNFASGPHTAIVWSNNGSNICWIDSNYVSPYKVGVHCQTISDYLKSVTIGGVQKYTVYQITG